MGFMPRRRGRSTGQALLEFSLILPVFLIMLMGVIDLGRAIWAQNSLAAAAREGARLAIVHGGSATTACPIGPAGPREGDPPGGTPDFPHPSPPTTEQMIPDPG